MYLKACSHGYFHLLMQQSFIPQMERAQTNVAVKINFKFTFLFSFVSFMLSLLYLSMTVSINIQKVLLLL